MEIGEQLTITYKWTVDEILKGGYTQKHLKMEAMKQIEKQMETGLTYGKLKYTSKLPVTYKGIWTSDTKQLDNGDI